eukprot:TRINITY_DN31663_c0_g1_i2.p1 TRINITY_DN31663_c0_g1~~TRINITY_DN31663_c0_g1_i2.p1  ORF type:complete len:276 (+),score=88.32 TRINITY_DN31663_c0_g1_i2:114-941(+)
MSKRDAVIAFLKSNPDGVSDSFLKTKFPREYEKMVEVFNELLSQNRMALFQRNDEYIYKYVAERDAARVQGLQPEEHIVLELIGKAGNTGIWTRDLKSKTGLAQGRLTKVLKHLESRRLIKSVKSIQGKNKKIYMLFELEPSREVTGGPWYSDQEFDFEFIDHVCNFVMELLHMGKTLGATDIEEKVRSSGISKVELGPDEIKQILDVLMFDGRIEHFRDKFGNIMYKPVESATALDGVIAMPCGSCPIADECDETGAICPATCLYLKKWLDESF